MFLGDVMKFIPFLLLLVLILAMWLLPSATPALSMSFLAISLCLAFFSIFTKQRTAFLQGRITHTAFLRNTLLDVFGILLAIALAVLLGQYIVAIITKPIGNQLVRLTTGILLGLLVGMGAGIFVNKVWGRFVKTSA